MLRCIGFLVVSCAGLMGCGGGERVDAAGHQVSMTHVRHVTMIGDYRVQTRHVYAARNYPIPKTYQFSFGWTPKADAERKQKAGLNSPTEQDWQRAVSFAQRAGLKDPQSYVSKRRNHAAKSDFVTVVDPKGAIKSCDNGIGGIIFCNEGINLSQATRIRLAQTALDQNESGCRVNRLDPVEVQALSGGKGMVSSPKTLVAVVACD